MPMIVQIKGTAVLDTIKTIKEGEFERIVGHLDEETQKVFQGEIFLRRGTHSMHLRHSSRQISEKQRAGMKKN